MSNLKWKALIIVLTSLVCLYGIIGLPKSKDELIANWSQNIKLGLDLRGGTLLVLQVQLQDAFKAEATTQVERIKEELNRQGIPFSAVEIDYEPTSLDDAERTSIAVKGVPADRISTFRSAMTELMPAWNLTGVSSTDYRLEIKTTEALELKRQTLEGAMQTIESRINGLGLAEASVQQRGGADSEAEILISLPGLDDPARVKSILQTAAMLELYEVKGGPYPRQEDAYGANGGVLPLGTKLIRSTTRAGEQGEGWFLVARTPVITGRDLRDSRPMQDEFGKWETSFVLSQESKGRFGRFTEANVNNRLAIVLDNQVRSAPVIQSRIDDQGRITGAGTQQEASDLALVLRAGSLPAGVQYLQEQTVGPSLGADSIRQGLTAAAAGIGLVIICMLVYYRMSGINATVALILNALILVGVLAYLDAVLTLPGIAGIILLIGMAVDSNVLIFERIREELAAGKAVLAAIDNGFSKAFLTIIDTHVTTVVSCAFLFMFGTPAIRGFAVTLVIGLAANVFTAIFVSRAIFQWVVSRQRGKIALSI
ncbi:MAG TPA: protein translocase subunit SecD [Bryobacteraceae bacterium]|nr:protein translocase subunit SecD [Bryobacterales bacterium]HRJ20218.1 protein translocase subunit SecD [Bryobacteraceae bacterium]